jgi:pyruvate formate lyase activating enzyme
MEFRGWQKTSLLEYPGKVSTVLFTGGCNFRCPFCYNRDIVLRPETLEKITESEVLGFLKQRQKLYQAVIVTGGEPTMHGDLPAFYKKVKKLGLLAGLETNGTNPEMLKKLLDEKLLDFIGMDIKAPLEWEKYGRAAGIKDRHLFDNVLKSVKVLKESGIDYEFRTTVVPGMHTEEDIIEIAGQLKGAKMYALQKFKPEDTTIDPRFAKLAPYPDSFLTDLCSKIRKSFRSCEVRNVNK